MAITKMSNSGIASTGSEKYNDMLAGNSPYIPPSFDSITSAIGTGSSATITFSSITSTYKHLQIRGTVGWSTNNETIQLRLNGDTGSNYASHQLQGNGSTANSSGTANASQIRLPLDGTTYDPSGIVPIIIDIYDYASTSKNKTIKAFLGSEINGNPSRVSLVSGVWLNTAAITSVSVSLQGGTPLRNRTILSLYGIQG
jgi:hypothetical protein